MAALKVGVVGCGNISPIYFANGRVFETIDITCCADIDMDKARARAEEMGVTAMTVDALLASDVDIVLNITVPKAHAAVSLAALQAGKHVYAEKPFAVTRSDGEAVMTLAREKGLRVGCAPDTFLGAAIQTCRKLMDDGWIGEPVGATAYMLGHGPESWHPNAEFYYETGGGPMFDMGPYYLTALVNLLGPVRSVMGCNRMTFRTRTMTSQHKYGKVIPVEIPTHVNAMLEFVNGAIGNVTMSFDVWASSHPLIEIYGTEGSMSVPDPNGFGGQILVHRAGQSGWTQMPFSHIYAENGRGIGLADMAAGILKGRPHRANGDLAFHVLDIMQAVHESSDHGVAIPLTSTVERPEPLPMGLQHGQVDLPEGS